MASSYTFAKLTDVEDFAPKYGIGAHQESRFARDALQAERTGVAHHRFRPGHRQGFAHRHDEAEEVYVVIGGSGAIKIDDDILELQRLDAVRVAPAAIRRFEAGPDGLEVLAFGPRHDGDGEAIHGWWDD